MSPSVPDSINPLYWFLLSLGLQRRSLYIAFLIAPWVTAAYLIGLPYGAEGVAAGFSAALTLFLVPCLMWCLHGTMISTKELFGAVSRPLLSALVAAIAAYAFHAQTANALNAFVMLLTGGAVMLAVYLGMLLAVFGQWDFYLDLIKGLVGSTRIPFLGRSR